MPRGVPRNPKVRDALVAAPILPAVIPAIAIPPLVPPPAPPAIAAAQDPVVAILPVVPVPLIPIAPVIPIVDQVIAPAAPALPQQVTLEDRVIPSANNFLTRYDMQFFQSMERSVSLLKLRLKRTPIDALRGNMTIVLPRHAGAELTFDNMVPIEESLYRVIPGNDTAAALAIARIYVGHITEGSSYPINVIPTDYVPEALLVKADYRDGLLTITQHAAFVMHPDKRSKLNYLLEFYEEATTAASALAIQATTAPTTLAEVEPNIYLRNIAISNAKADNAIIVGNYKVFTVLVNNNHEHANKLVQNCMNISRDDVTSKLLAGKNISETIKSYPVNAVPGGLYQLMVANYSEKGSIRNKRVESLGLGFFISPWLNKDKIKCIDCVRDALTGATCFENHSKFTILALSLEIFRGDENNKDCLYFWENIWVPAIKLCKDTGDYSLESLPPKLISRILCRLFSEVMAIVRDTNNANLPMRHLLALCHDKQNAVPKKEHHDTALYNNMNGQTPQLQHISMIDGSNVGETPNVPYGENKDKTESNKNNNNNNYDKHKNNHVDRYNNYDRNNRDQKKSRDYKDNRDYRDGRDYDRDRNKYDNRDRNYDNRDSDRDRQRDNRGGDRNKENKPLCLNHLANLLGVQKHLPCQYGKSCRKYHIEKPKDFSNKKLYPTFVKEAKAILATEPYQGTNKKDFKAAMLDELKHH